MKRLFFLILPLCMTPGLAQDPGGGGVTVEEVKESFLTRLQQMEQARDWRGLYELYRGALEKHARENVKVIREEEGEKWEQWISLPDHLVQRFSSLPPEAFEVHRLEGDSALQATLDRARAGGSLEELSQAIDRHFFSRVTDEAVDFLANRKFQEGRGSEAAQLWKRLLQYHPAVELPRGVLAARLAEAACVSGDREALEWVTEEVKTGRLKGNESDAIRIGTEEKTLATILSGISLLEPPPSAPAEESRVPRNDILRWTYHFSEEENSPANVRQPHPGQGNVRPLVQFPLIPAGTTWAGKDYLFVTNGYQVLARDPKRVNGNSRSQDPGERKKAVESGTYWDYPYDRPVRRPSVPGGAGQRGLGFLFPLIGCSTADGVVYCTMYSKERRTPTGMQGMDLYEGPTSLVALTADQGFCLWNTDYVLVEGPGANRKSVLEGMEFSTRNWSFSSPPLVSGDRLFIGINTSPFGEQNSWVLCLDRRTGRPVWCTFIASVSGNAQPFWDGRVSMTNLTLLADGGETIYVQTSLGILGALQSSTGRVVWLTPYRREMTARRGAGPENQLRAPNRPWVGRDVLLSLAQDRSKLLVANRRSGRLRNDLVDQVSAVKGLQWASQQYLMPADDRSVILGGASSWLLRFGADSEVSVSELTLNMNGCGRGVTHGSRLLVPTRAPGMDHGALSVITRPHWKLDQILPWKTADSGGNLAVVGGMLVTVSDRVQVYTDLDTQRGDFDRRLKDGRATPEQWRRYGDLMRDNGQLAEATQSYLHFLGAVGTAPERTAEAAAVRADLYGVLLKQGLLSLRTATEGEAVPKAWEEAVQHLEKARGYAPDVSAQIEVRENLSQAYQGLGRGEEAVRVCQEILLSFPDGPSSKGKDEIWRSPRMRAELRIRELLEKFPRTVYEAIEREAEKALSNVAEGDEKGLKSVLLRYPNSRVAGKTLERRIELLRREGRARELPSAWEARLGMTEGKDIDGRRAQLEALETCGDFVRARALLSRLVAEHPGETIRTGDSRTKIEEYAAQKTGEWDRKVPKASPPGAWKKIALLFPPNAGGEGSLFPLAVEGVRPPSLGIGREFFSRGSVVELWEVGAEPRRIWSRNIPGDPKSDVSSAAFTAEYLLAVSSGASVHAIDPEDGSIRWSHTRTEGALTILKAAGSQLLLRWNASVSTPRRRPSGPVQPAGAEVRLLSLNGDGGEVRWERILEAGAETSLICVSPVVTGLTAVARIWNDTREMKTEVFTFHPVSGEKVFRGVAARGGAVIQPGDESEECLWYQDGMSLQRLGLRSEKGAESSKGFPLSLNSLQPQFHQCVTAAGGGSLSIGLILVGPRRGADYEMKYSLFRLPGDDATHPQPLQLPAKRGLLQGRRDILEMDPEGGTYVYNYSGLETAHLTYFGPGSPDPTWEAPAPHVQPSDGRQPIRILPMRGHVAFWAQRALKPGEKVPKPRAVLIDRRTGMLVREWENLDRGMEGIPSMVRLGERLFVMTEEGTEVYGE